MKSRTVRIIVALAILVLVATVLISATPSRDEKNGMFVAQTGESTTGRVEYPDTPSNGGEQTWPAQTRNP